MKFAMCNEFCVDWPIDRVFALAAETGFQGVEFAPFTLAPSADQVTPEQVDTIRNAASEHGVEVVGLHWLLAKTEGFHITTADDAVRERTAAYLDTLIDLCHAIGGDRMIFGSPGQRNLDEGQPRGVALDRAVGVFKKVTPKLEDLGITLCMEPLARTETDFIRTKDEAEEVIAAVDSPNFRLILDCKAMADEDKPAPRIIREAADNLAHFHANDDTKSYPGTGGIDFPAILAALREIGYRDWVSIEVFDFTPPPEQIAREGLAHLKASM